MLDHIEDYDNRLMEKHNIKVLSHRLVGGIYKKKCKLSLTSL